MYETETAFEDDRTSFMTTAELGQNQECAGFLDDATKLSMNPRKFKGYLPILEALNIANYDSVPSMNKLEFKMREALANFQKLW